LQLCQNRNTLDVGCTCYPAFQGLSQAGTILHQKLAPFTSQLIGIDIAERDVEQMKSLGFDARLIDAQTMANSFAETRFDVILLADIIEHVPNPGLILSEARKLLAPTGIIVISVPNAFGITRFLKTVFRYESVHHDHVAYYTSGTLETLGQKYDLDIIELNWYRLDSANRGIKMKFSLTLEKVITHYLPWYAEGCIAVLKAQ